MASLKDRALVTGSACAQPGTLGAPSLGLLSPGTRNRLIYHLCSAQMVRCPQTHICSMHTSAFCSIQELWGYFLAGALPCQQAHMYTFSTILLLVTKSPGGGRLPRATRLSPTSYSPSNVRADLGVRSNRSVGKSLGAAGVVVAREDHGRHNNGQDQPQPQQHHADCGPPARGHGSAAQWERGRSGADRPVNRQMPGQLCG